ncbi:MAG: hypothetical protein AAFQ62_15715 [Pseudomonadota bacterium]
MKRYFLAFVALIVVAFAVQYAVEIMRPWLVEVFVYSGADPDAKFRRVVVLAALIVFFRNFVSFGVGAWVLKKGAIAAGLSLFAAIVLGTLGYAWFITETTQDFLTLLKTLIGLWPTVAAELVGAFAGLCFGQWVATR